MARLLRGAGLRAPVVEDALAEARRIREDAEAEARRLVAGARDRAAGVEADALARGLEAARAEQAAALLEAGRLRDGALDQARAEVATLAVAVARRLLGEELSLEPERILRVVDDAVARARAAGGVELRLHPDDAATVERALRSRGGDDPGPTVVPDPTIERGGCLARSALGEVDARVTTRVDRLLEALSTGAGRPGDR